jgi:4-amino-4-deoxy-L-arabinose transferase-like glycosyltransferase
MGASMKSLRERFDTAYSQFQSQVVLSDRNQYLILILIVLAVLAIRLVMIGTPSLEWTGWKEIDYLTISKNYWQNGFNFLKPEVTWPAEPPRVTEMELPLVPYATAAFYQLFGYGAFAARLVPMLSFLVMVVYVYKLAKREVDPFVGLLAGLAAGLMPLYHPFSNTLFTEPAMIAMSVVSLYYMAEWVEHQRRREQILALIALSLTFSLKLESLYLLLPLSWIAFRQYKFEVRKYFGFAALIALSFVLPVIWYSYAYYLENTGAHLFGIFKGHDKSQIVTMLTDLRWYRTMAGRVINGIFGGPYGSALFLLGLGFAFLYRKGGLIFAYLVSVCIYFVLVAEGNVDAPYRQFPLIPSAAVFVALGAQTLVIGLSALAKSISAKKAVLAAIPFVIVLLVPVTKLDQVFAPNGPAHADRWQFATEIKKHSDENSKLVVLGEYSKHVGGYDLSPVLYYYSGLQGWTLKPEQWTIEYIEGLRQKGATHFAVILPYGYPYDFVYLPEASYDAFVAEMRNKYPVLYEYQDQLLLDLR